MIAVKNRVIFGIISRTLKIVLTFIYKIFAIFNLVYTCFFAVLGLVLYVLGVFEKNTDILMIFYLFLGLSVVYAIVKTILNVVNFNKKIFHKNSKTAEKKEEVKQTDNTESFEEENQFNNKKEVNVEFENGESFKPISNQFYVEKPRYYYVKQNHNYVVADFSNRVELLLITEQGFKKIKTEYK